MRQLILSALCLMMANTGLANNVLWQSNGGGCVPTDATIQQNQYWTVTGAGRVKYKGSGTSPLVFSCPVSNISETFGGDGTVLRLFYQDPDGPGSNYSVTARLLAFAKSNGALRQVCRASSSAAGQWRVSEGVCSSINPDRELYWVEVVVKRAQASRLVVEFNGVSLETRVF